MERWFKKEEVSQLREHLGEIVRSSETLRMISGICFTIIQL